MNILDSPTKLEEIDTGHVLATVSMFPKQVSQAQTEVDELTLPTTLSGAKNIVLAGMGGSALPGFILKSFGEKLIRVPFEVVTESNLPAYANRETLVILSSYSGNTAETLSCSRQAIKLGAKTFVFTVGGKLAKFAEEHRLPIYKPVPVFNPSAQPRFSLGYSVTCLLEIMTKLGYMSLNKRTTTVIPKELTGNAAGLLPVSPTFRNPAKQLALEIDGFLPVLVAGSHLIGTSVAVRNMLHETAKTMAVNFDLPELNHHLLEALSFPQFLPAKTKFIFFDSARYTLEIRKRLRYTVEVLGKRGFAHANVEIAGESGLHEAYRLLQFGGFTAYYLAALEGADPAAIPWVDYFKKKLEG